MKIDKLKVELKEKEKEINKRIQETLEFHKPYFIKSHFEEKNWLKIILRDMEVEDINYRLLKVEISALKKGISACEKILNSQQINGKNTYTSPIVPLKNSEPLEIGCDGELPSADTLRGSEDGE